MQLLKLTRASTERCVPTEYLLFVVQGAHMRTYNELVHGLCSKTVQIIISVQKDAEGCLIFGLLFSCTVHWQVSTISYQFCQILKYHFNLSGPMFISGPVEGANPE